MKPLCALLVLSLLLAACAPEAPATAALPTPQISRATHTPTPFPPARTTPLPGPTAAAPQDLLVAAPDGARLAASYYAPAVSPQAGAGAAPGVLLLPMLGASRADWDAFARELQSYGIAALTLDPRGQGASAGPADWAKAPGDVRAAWEALTTQPAVDPAATAIVGASIGANLALIAGANNPAVLTVAALSPGQDYQGVQPGPALANFGARPIFLIASQDDAYAYASVQKLAGQAAAAETYYFKTAGHGTAMFSDPALAQLLIDWLTQKLGVLKG